MGGVEYQVTKVDPTDPETKGMVYQVHKVSEEVAATLGGKVYRARIIKDPTEPTVAGKVYQIVLIDDPEDPAVKGKVYNAILTGGSEVVVIGPAVSPLALDDAIADSLSYVKAFGGTEQRNLPDGYTALEYIESSGTQYIDIDVSGNATFIGTAQSTTDSPTSSQVLVANSGAGAGHWFGVQSPGAGSSFAKRWGLGATATASSTIDGTTKVDFEITFTQSSQYGTVNDQVLNRESSTSAHTNWIIFAGNTTPSYGFIGKVWGLKVVQNDVLVRNFVPAKNSSNVVGMYDLVSRQFFANQGTGDFVAGPTAVPTPDAPMNIVSNNGALKAGQAVTIDPTRNYAYINATGSWSWSNDSYSIALPVEVGKNYKIDITNTDATVIGTIFRYGFTDEDPEDFKQSEVTPSPVSVPIYDYWRGTPQELSSVTVTATHPYLVIQFSAAFAASVVSTYLTIKKQVVYTDGTVETIKDSLNNTATAEILLKVGDYQDVQSILDGAVTRSIGVKVFDGTEDWESTSTTGLWLLRNVEETVLPSTCICTHFLGVSTTTSGPNMPDLSIRYGVTGYNNRLYIRHNSLASVDGLKQILATQYAAGTPVIVIYPLATPTTETVTGQTLQVQDGDNTLEITQASMDGLELEAEYEKEA